jgi:amino acid adenylation domain-containing protein
LMRLTLIQVAERKAILVWSYHHLILDRWSIEVVQEEVWAAYQALRRGEAVPDEKPRPFREYLEWLPKQDLAEAERYWRRTLKGFTAPTLLGVERESVLGEHQPGHYDVQDLTLSEPATAALERFARQHQVTLNTVVQGAWAVVLSRYSGTEEVVFGITSSGRSAELQGMETMVGMFITTLPVRVKVDQSQLVTMWLKEMQTQQVGMRQYEYTPLFEIQKWSEVSPGMPLFNTLLIFENTPGGKVSTTGPEGLSVQQVFVASDLKTNYPLNLACFADRPLHMLITYDTEHFEAAAISRVLSHIQQVLAEMVAEPEQTLGNISLITEAERRQLLVEWNATETAYPRKATLAEQFEAQVAATPDAVAVVFDEQQLTYSELNTRANHLAQHLHQQHGVGPEVCVGLCMERSVEMVVGLLGIVKAGGAYVPLDPGTPPERLAFMLQDADIALALTQDALKAHFPAEWAGPVIALDTEWAPIAQTPATNLTRDVTAENLAYIMYTSGSTGQPKGIGIPQRAVIRLVLETNYIDLNASDRVAQTSTISFDAATFELWGALLNGGQLVIIPKTIALSPQDLAAHLQHYGITTMFLTTALFNQMAREAPEAFRGMRHLLFGGEAVDPRWVREVLQAVPPQRLLHVYGPTENTTFTTWHLTEYVPPGETTVPIGRPIANTQVYVLDRAMQPVPVGVYGELFIGGDGLARDYLKRPALTAETFVPNPFSPEPGARLYKSGDLVRYLQDGSIEFLGRIDHQVKIRGFRIELGEIESVLGRHPKVSDTVVIAREDVPGDKRLVAYVVASHEPTPTFSELRSFLKEKLPDYMIPTALVFLDLLPLTPNGKVDRRALPAPELSRSELENKFVAPRTPVEEAIAGIWCKVLGLERLGVHDNFFELGGHSLLATQIISRLSNVFQVEIPLRQLFLYPTIAELTLIIAGKLEKTEQETVKQLLDEFEDLSDEEAERLLAQELRQNERADRSE